VYSGNLLAFITVHLALWFIFAVIMKTISGNIVDVISRTTFSGKLTFDKGIIVAIEPCPVPFSHYIIPGFTDAHIHIESSMLVPSGFARLAVQHGTVCTVSDPHEIANVLGIEGVRFMIENGSQLPFRFCFGAPSCVPATPFETAGAVIGITETEALFDAHGITYLSEMMNYPGVLNQDEIVTGKLTSALKRGLPVDGHAPGLTGEEVRKYAAAGISTDHECFTIEEALSKIEAGMHILIREGSAARNFDTLLPLLNTHPHRVMFCSDDLHPDDLALGHINRLVVRAIRKGCDLYDVLRACTVNPARHYNTGTGYLQPGQSADFVVVENLEEFPIRETWIGGEKVYEKGNSLIPHIIATTPNRFMAGRVTADDFQLIQEGPRMRVIGVTDGQIVTQALTMNAPQPGRPFEPDKSGDLALLAVINRYNPSKPALAVVKGMGIHAGALASSVAHDSHNIIATGINADEIANAVNLVIENKGGLAVSNKGRKLCLPLPVAGIMSNADAFDFITRYKQIHLASKLISHGTTAPFMTLSFLALLVIPELKLSDKGLFDGRSFRYVSNFFS
jgi:adenine deaminase